MSFVSSVQTYPRSSILACTTSGESTPVGMLIGLALLLVPGLRVYVNLTFEVLFHIYAPVLWQAILKDSEIEAL